MRRYYALTRSPTHTLLFALPLLLFYEVGAIYIARVEGSEFRNGADVLLRTLFALAGLEGTLAITALLTGAALALIIHDRRRAKRPLRAAHFAGMAAESGIYALFLGVIVGSATAWILRGVSLHLSAGSLASLSPVEGVVLSLGAGIYEELVFRVLAAGGLFAAFRGSGLSRGQSGLLAVLLSSLLFSAFHYVGPYGDPWALPSFLFRFLAGVAFSVLFLVRGFGIAAWTHALYDVFLVLSITS